MANKSKFIIYLSILLFTACDSSICGNELIQQADSPGKKYIASIFERNCGATTPFIRVVSLRLYNSEFDPEEQKDWVFSIQGQPNIEVEWLNAKEIKISFASGGSPRQSTKWNDVVISY